MTSTQTQRRRIFKGGLAVLMVGAVLSITGFVSAPAGAAPKQLMKVTICHRTNAPSNPYRIIAISVDAANGEVQGPDHTGHAGPAFDFSADPADPGYPYTTPRNGDQWGDIIPPYQWNGGSFPGMNWEDGEAIWDAQCGVPAEPAVGSITLDKVTAGDNQPVDTTPFTFSVVCDDATVPEAAPAISPADPVAIVATDVAMDSTCTIGETDAAGAASTTFSVDGATGVAGPVTVTMTDAKQAIEIVATNTFACPAGQVSNGRGGCTSTGCQPTTGNNQCTPCQTGTPDGQGGCTIITDACPGLDGIQASVAECPPVVVQDNTVTPTPTPTPPVVQVEGVQLTAAPAAPTQVAAAQLPRTGTNTLPLAELGLGLVLLGAGALIYGRDQTATV